ncbi:MAG: hypothetical protein KF832_29250 [Caldilineaceae bacterium]|nr:hypothetical protein [Caldilineaceae bacterium]
MQQDWQVSVVSGTAQVNHHRVWFLSWLAGLGRFIVTPVGEPADEVDNDSAPVVNERPYAACTTPSNVTLLARSRLIG